MGSDTFSKKIKELSLEEIQYTEDFFNKAFGDDRGESITMLQASAQGPAVSISSSFGNEDIDENWLKEEESYAGQLAVDVFQTDEHIIITSTVAGVKAEDIDIDMNGDMITIKGMRRHPFDDIQNDDYFIRECYWGGFSRSIILPVDIQHDKVEAKLDHGVLLVRLPKSQRSHNSRIDVIDISK